MLDFVTSEGRAELSGPKNHSKFTSTTGGGWGTNSTEQVIVIVSPNIPVVGSLIFNGPTCTATVMGILWHYYNGINYYVLVLLISTSS